MKPRISSVGRRTGKASSAKIATAILPGKIERPRPAGSDEPGRHPELAPTRPVTLALAWTLTLMRMEA
jgi:hypothetical protein